MAVVLFTCGITRTVHLERVNDLSIVMFMQGLLPVGNVSNLIMMT